MSMPSPKYDNPLTSKSRRQRLVGWIDDHFGSGSGPLYFLLLTVVFGLLIAAGLTALVYFAYPMGAIHFAALFGLSGPIALVLPLLVLSLASLFLVLSALVFSAWSLTIDQDDGDQQKPVRYFALVSIFIAGLAVGVFLAAASPAIFTLLPAFGLTGAAGVAVSLTLAALITGLVFLVISAFAARWVYSSITSVPPIGGRGYPEEPQPPEAAEDSLEALIKKARELCLPKIHGGGYFTAPQYAEAISIFEQVLERLRAMPSTADNPNLEKNLHSIEFLSWEKEIAAACQTSERGDIYKLALTKLRKKIEQHQVILSVDDKELNEGFVPAKAVMIESLSFILELAQKNDPVLLSRSLTLPGGKSLLIKPEFKEKREKAYKALSDHLHSANGSGINIEAAGKVIGELLSSPDLEAKMASVAEDFAVMIRKPNDLSGREQDSESKASFEHPITGDSCPDNQPTENQGLNARLR